ncbi:MAG: hypothetical protein DYH08_00555, partial [Actinobacteria bacterium ATB1]|nr:hypothetical protein [Actinobacteria bacterium ATB1]
MARAGLPPTIWPFACHTKEIGEIEGEGALPCRVAVFGDAGVGKSRLLSEVLVRDASNGHRTVHVVGARSLASVPFGAFAGVLEGSLPDRGSRFDVLQLALQDLSGAPNRRTSCSRCVWLS